MLKKVLVGLVVATTAFSLTACSASSFEKPSKSITHVEKDKAGKSLSKMDKDGKKADSDSVAKKSLSKLKKSKH